MKFPENLAVYGDQAYRGDCPSESSEQIAFFSELKRKYPLLHAIAIHPKNEGKRAKGQFQQLAKDKAMGLNVGSADIIIPASPAFVCELKRKDHTQSKFQAGQVEYLESCKAMGAFVCVALGYEAAMQAVDEYAKVICIKEITTGADIIRALELIGVIE